MDKVIVFHNNCLDGFLSAILMTDAIKVQGPCKIGYISANYGDKPFKPTKDHQDIYLVDFSYPRDVIENYINHENANICIFDHHETAIQNLGDLARDLVKKYKPIQFELDGDPYYYLDKGQLYGWLADNRHKEPNQQFSGAGLIYDWMKHSALLVYTDLNWYTKEDSIKTIELAQRHDLWHHDGDPHDPATYLSYWFKDWYQKHKENFKHLTINNVENNESTFKLLADTFKFDISLEDKLKIGKELVEVSLVEIRKYCDKAVPVKFDTGDLKYVDDYTRIGLIQSNDAKLNISLTCSTLVKEYGYDIAIIAFAEEGTNNIVYSFRSDQNGTDVDVGLICKNLFDDGIAITGGGHRNAAGCKLHKDKTLFKVAI